MAQTPCETKQLGYKGQNRDKDVGWGPPQL